MDTIGTIDELHTVAATLTGLSDFGPSDYLEGLEVVLASYEKEASLTPDGVRAIRDELCGILVARLLSEAGWHRHPEHAQVPIERPVFIVGMPRTGTTTLHRLLTADPANQGLELWLTYAPQPRPPRSTWPDNPIFEQVRQGVGAFMEQHPGYLGIHNRTADGVEECWLLTRQSMLSAYFEFTGYVPTYSAWLAGQDWTGAYQRHRRNLQLIGLNDQGRRWVLKSSSHMPCLDALLATYPDALVIQTHRRPASAVLGSACSMVSHLAAGKSSTFHGQAIGPVLFDMATRALERFAADRAKHDPATFYDVEFDAFIADPLAVVADIYRHLGWELADEVGPAMLAVLAEDARLRSHRYELADFGVNAAEVDSRLGALL
ncbi:MULTISPECIES: sulfotransferase [unclassified Pseudofrankia]|uniref:sulfotransferase family protein n=1 Tax=unclassified Pseudofrankia TaxID=2994372 RepID=UPI0008DA7630|nr:MULTISPECIES: sulfotransferase [unclassified Pseudofrankia]MDT3443239.1 sulfotransferase [Pseudofrankia sp. BMG5.37]OHV62744.1 sulfotransferase [Pseudofrankia sp. BMG5.36]